MRPSERADRAMHLQEQYVWDGGQPAVHDDHVGAALLD
jgi:hypothetical protein